MCALDDPPPRDRVFLPFHSLFAYRFREVCACEPSVKKGGSQPARLGAGAVEGGFPKKGRLSIGKGHSGRKGAEARRCGMGRSRSVLLTPKM